MFIYLREVLLQLLFTAPPPLQMTIFEIKIEIKKKKPSEISQKSWQHPCSIFPNTGAFENRIENSNWTETATRGQNLENVSKVWSMNQAKGFLLPLCLSLLFGEA